tara:strand:+ start:541 stop:762 length:222 start_codon:yes stop_codon:yes gene_type:complete
MSGHNAVFELGQDQVGANSFEGKFLLISSAIGGDAGIAGYGKGALAVDISTGKLHINTNTISSATWTVVGSQS